MKNEIKIYKNDALKSELRLVEKNGHTFFCLKDVCDSLDLENYNRVKNRLEERGLTTSTTPTRGGVQSLLFINEPNLYRCIFQSRKKEAEAFQNWVYEDVLPSIRKTGSYFVKKSTFLERTPQVKEVLELVSENLYGIKQKDLAREIGCDVSSIRRVLKGEFQSRRVLSQLYKRALENRKNLLLTHTEQVRVPF